MIYRLELRRMGAVIREYETESRREAKETAKHWLATTVESVLILFIDGKEVRLKDTRKALGLCGRDFDNLKRYSTRYEGVNRILRRSGVGAGGRVGSHVHEYSDER